MIKEFIKFCSVLILIIPLLVSCSQTNSSDTKFTKINKNKLPSTPGVYFFDGKNSIEVFPSEVDDTIFKNVFHIDNSNPEFVIYNNEVNPDTYFLYDYRGNNIPLAFNDPAQNRAENGLDLVQVKPMMDLEDSFYCFSQTTVINPVIGRTQNPVWCFSQGSENRLGIDSTTDNNYSLPISNFGFFLVDNGNVELIPPTPLDEEIDISSLPITNSLLPTILYQSNTGNLNDVQLYWRRAIIGIGLNGNMVTKLYTELGAALSGIQLEDILVKVNNVDLTTLDKDQIISTISNFCVAENTIDIEILRGTQRFLAQPECSLDSGTQLGGFEYILKSEGYAEFQISFPLYIDNVYCLYVRNSGEKSCFLVQ